jgi:hypothetical protein
MNVRKSTFEFAKPGRKSASPDLTNHPLTVRFPLPAAPANGKKEEKNQAVSQPETVSISSEKARRRPRP